MAKPSKSKSTTPASVGKSASELATKILEAAQDTVSGKSDTARTVASINFGYVFGNCDDAGNITSSRTSSGSIGLESYISQEFIDKSKRPDKSVMANVDGLMIPPGVVAIFGPASSGKTPLLRYIVASLQKVLGMKGSIIHYGEPIAGSLLRAEEAAQHLIGGLSDSGVCAVGVDSVKNLLSRAPEGAAGSGGISRAIWPMLSDWASMASSLNTRIVVPINVSTSDDRIKMATQEAIKSNVTTALIYESPDVYSFLTRTEGGKRLSGTINITWHEAGVKRLLLAGSASEAANVITERTALDITTASMTTDDIGHVYQLQLARHH